MEELTEGGVISKVLANGAGHIYPHLDLIRLFSGPHIWAPYATRLAPIEYRLHELLISQSFNELVAKRVKQGFGRMVFRQSAAGDANEAAQQGTAVRASFAFRVLRAYVDTGQVEEGLAQPLKLCGFLWSIGEA